MSLTVDREFDSLEVTVTIV